MSSRSRKDASPAQGRGRAAATPDAPPPALAALSPWQSEDLAGDTLALAPALLGSVLVRVTPDGILAGRIVETEAYLAEGDPACHAHRGETLRNRAMFGPPGRAYVYRIYGIHWCVNVVTEPAGRGSAVLLRALEPIAGIDRMAANRGGSRDLTNGPGRLCQALSIDGTLDHVDLTHPGELYLLRGAPPESVVAATRIGITQAADRAWRFYERGNPWVSRRSPVDKA